MRASHCPWLFLAHTDVFLSMSLVMELLAVVPASVCGHPSSSLRHPWCPWKNLQVMRGGEESELMGYLSLWDPVYPCRVSRFWEW